MFEGLQENQLAGALEALLFVTDEPVSTLALADMVEMPTAQVQKALRSLAQRCEEENRGIQLREVAGGWRLFSHPAYHELIGKYVVSWDTRKLTPAALETLAVVAYSQPVTRGGIASIRGVNSDSTLNSLVDKGLVREAGTADLPGNPMLYATTRVFLEHFGLRSVEDLPDIAQFAPDDETRAFIKDRLSATRIDDAEDSLIFEDDEGTVRVASEDASAQAGEMVDALQAALASSLGVTEKIDFDKLTFNTDDE